MNQTMLLDWKTQLYPGWDQEEKESTCAYSCYPIKWGEEEQEGDLISPELLECGEEIRVCCIEIPVKFTGKAARMPEIIKIPFLWLLYPIASAVHPYFTLYAFFFL